MLLVGNQIGLYSSIISPQYTHFLHSVKIFGYKMKIKFDGDPLVLGQNNYTTKAVSAYIVWDLDTWPKILFNNFTLEIPCLERLI